MVHSELWLVYKQVSRCGKPATAQLIELEFQNHKLHDLEDVLEHVFQQGFVDAKLRPLSWWEKCDGAKVKGCIPVEELLDEGVGRSQETALRLVIGEAVFLYPRFHDSLCAHDLPSSRRSSSAVV